MNANDFNRAVDFLQGALNIATRSAAKEARGSQSEDPISPHPTRSDPLLPGFEPPAENHSPASEPVPPEEVPAIPADPFTPPPDANAPPLPGMMKAPMRTHAPIPPPTSEKTSSLELHPPALKRASLASCPQGAKRDTDLRFGMSAVFATLSGVLGLGLVIALVCLLKRPEPSVEMTPADIPLALLPDTADPSLWETVSGMSGEIGGTFLRFERGLASGNGITYKLLLDFCRNGSDVYAKVAGDKTYVVRLDGQGRIIRAYPAPKNNRPLRDIFGN